MNYDQGQCAHIGNLGNHLGHQSQKHLSPPSCCLSKMAAGSTPHPAVFPHGELLGVRNLLDFSTTQSFWAAWKWKGGGLASCPAVLPHGKLLGKWRPPAFTTAQSFQVVCKGKGRGLASCLAVACCSDPPCGVQKWKASLLAKQSPLMEEVLGKEHKRLWRPRVVRGGWRAPSTLSMPSQPTKRSLGQGTVGIIFQGYLHPLHQAWLWYAPEINPSTKDWTDSKKLMEKI